MLIFLFLLHSPTNAYDDGVFKGKLFLNKKQSEALEIFEWYRVSFSTLHERLYFANFDSNLIAQLNDSGELINSYQQPGTGPGDIKNPRLLIEYGDDIAAFNFLNRQFVILSKDLKFIKNNRVDFFPKYMMPVSKSLYAARLVDDTQLLGLVGRHDLKLISAHFPKQTERDASGLPIGSTDISFDDGLAFHYFGTIFRDAPSVEIKAFELSEETASFLANQPTFALALHELPTDLLPPIKRWPNLLGAVTQVFRFKTYIIVQCAIDGMDNDRIYCYDFFNKNSRAYLGRHVSPTAIMVNHHSDNTYLFSEEKIFTLSDIVLP